MKKSITLSLIALFVLSGLQTYGQLISDTSCTTPFEDISATGTATGLSDDGNTIVTLPFLFSLDGVVSSDLVIGNNGAVHFNTTGSFVAAQNDPLSGGSTQGFYPFWDDIDDDAGNVYHETRGFAPNRRFIVQWDNRDLWSLGTGGIPTDSITFQLVLHETSNEIHFVYADVNAADVTRDNGISATIGVVGANGAYQYSFNTASLSGVNCIHWSIPTCPGVNNLSSFNITPFTAETTWDELGTAVQWQIQYGVSGFILGSGTLISSFNDTATLASLLPNTSYDFYIRSICGPGDTSIWSTPSSFMTPPTCPEPTLLTSNSLSHNAAEVSWVENGSATAWEVEWGLTGFVQGSGMILSTTLNPDTLTGLNSATTYDFYVRSVCAPGDTSIWSTVNSFTTLPNYCGGDNFFDNGGSVGNYTDFASETTVICPDNPGDVVTATFLSFEVEGFGVGNCFDRLRIYDGPTTASTEISPANGFCWESATDGTLIPGGSLGVPIISTDASGCLTFEFYIRRIGYTFGLGGRY